MKNFMHVAFVLGLVLIPRVAVVVADEPKGGGPLAELGWNTKHCMTCGVTRDAVSQKLHSDKRGFGFCKECGPEADAFVVGSKLIKAGLPIGKDTEAQSKKFLGKVVKMFPAEWMNNDAARAKALLMSSPFVKWGDSDNWEQAWDDCVTLKLKKSDIQHP